VTSPARSGRRGAFIITLAVGLLLLLPSIAAAHAELDVPTPADGATVEGQPAEVSGTFTQDIDPDGSSLQLRDAAGAVVADGGVDPDDPRRMAITDLPELAPGDYEVRWTTISAEDGELDRDTWSFTVAAATAAPTPSPTAAPSASAATSPSASPTTALSPTTAPSTSPSPSGDGSSTGGTKDVLLPIIIGLALVVLGGWLLLRRRSSGPAA
jgi:copper resistance protein C